MKYESISITNNFVVMYGTGGADTILGASGAMGNNYRAYTSNPTLVFANNTIIANGYTEGGTGGSVSISDGGRTHQADNIVVQNNVFDGLETGRSAVSINYDPSNLIMTHNVYDATWNDQFYYNGSGYSTFAAWKTACSCDASAKICSPTFRDPGNQDFHLDLSDSCALGAGTDVPGMTMVDIDGDARPLGDWEVGADEVLENPPPLPPSPPGNLRERRPLRREPD
jgi:hypothetical protein